MSRFYFSLSKNKLAIKTQRKKVHSFFIKQSTIVFINNIKSKNILLLLLRTIISSFAAKTSNENIRYS